MKKKSEKLKLIILFFILFLSIFLNLQKSYSYLEKYDNYQIRNDGLEEHKLIKSDIHSIWSAASRLLEDDKKGISYFKSGKEYTRTYLPSLIVYTYFKLLGEEIEEKNIDKSTIVSDVKFKLKNGKLGLLIFQNIVFFLSMVFFYFYNRNIIKEKILLLSVFFICFEPTISQWHSFFFTESIFISLLIVFLSLILNLKNKLSYIFILGVLIGIMYLQKNLGFYLIIPVSIILFFRLKRKSIILIPIMFLGYLIPVLFLGMHNQVRSGEFYILSKHMKVAPYHYVHHKLISKQYKIETKKSLEIIKLNENNWLEKNNIDLSNELQRLKFYKFKQNEFFKSALENPITLFKIVIWKTLQSGILDPNYTLKFTEIDKSVERYWIDKDYNENLFLRIVYSSILYLLVVLGLIKMFQLKEYNLLLTIFILIIYLTLILGWVGVSRYFIVNLVPISILFSYGVFYLTDKFKNFKTSLDTKS